MRWIVFCFVFLLSGSSLQAKKYELESPSGTVKIIITVDKEEGISARTFFAGNEVMAIGPVWMDVEGFEVLGIEPRVRKLHRADVNEEFHPAVREKRAIVKNNYKEISLLFKSDFRLDFRAYDDGVAYRFRTLLGPQIQVNDERVKFSFPGDPSVYYPTEESFFTHSEREYEYLKVREISHGKIASLPALLDLENEIKILLTESHLEDYPGLYLNGSDDASASLTGIFPTFVLEEKLYRDRDMKPEKRADYLAITSGNRSFPWRVAAFSASDEELLGNDIVLRLAPESRIDDVSWIEPGMVSWDWWNATNNVGVPFISGVNTATYKYHIDFASDYGLEYIILDEGWSVPGDLFQINPECDMDEIMRYAHEKNVGIILWVLWNALDNDLEAALDKFEKWGVKGIKVDFMQRDDQAMVRYYWKVAKAAAEHKMLVDFHGSYKPTGIRRAYPNVVNREGLKGLENAKWSDLITPDHDCTLPFIRMVAGPMDYTPGAMRNAQKSNYSISFNRPMSQGTRSHQLALYVLFESPVQMLCDLPSHYYKEALSMEFLSVVPTVWDETYPLFGKIGDYAGIARKSGENYFIGVITDWSERDFDIDLSFLPDGRYELIQFSDGLNAGRYAEDCEKKVMQISSKEALEIHLAPGGGWVGILKPIPER
ncbi:MAG: glycoside hydrolase family 97 protein [Bacteroidetes bacterium]|nr:glycoside hydrolase family 97 protein [Bacteroidota bacterium]